MVEVWDVLVLICRISLGLVWEDSLLVLGVREPLVIVPVILFLLLDHAITGNKEVIIPSDHLQEAEVCVLSFHFSRG